MTDSKLDLRELPHLTWTQRKAISAYFRWQMTYTAYLNRMDGSSGSSDPHGSKQQKSGSSSPDRSEEHTSELQSPYVISYAVFCLNKKPPGAAARTLGAGPGPRGAPPRRRRS